MFAYSVGDTAELSDEHTSMLLTEGFVEPHTETDDDNTPEGEQSVETADDKTETEKATGRGQKKK